MYKDKGALLKKMHLLLNGKKGKGVCLVIAACIELGYMERPTHKQVSEEFGEIGNRQGFNNYLQVDYKGGWVRLSKTEIEGMKAHIKM